MTTAKLNCFDSLAEHQTRSAILNIATRYLSDRRPERSGPNQPLPLSPAEQLTLDILPIFKHLTDLIDELIKLHTDAALNDPRPPSLICKQTENGESAP